MNFIHSRFYSQLIQFSDYILLSILWVICCLPLITIVPATISLFAVVSARKNGTSQGMLSLFFSEMKQHFFKKAVMSLALIVFIFVVYQDIHLITPIESHSAFFLFLLLCVAVFLVVGSLVHFFNIFVKTENKKLLIICKNTLMLAISQFHWTLIGVVVICFAILLVLFLPIMIFIIGSFTAYLLTRISHKAMKNIQVKQQLIKISRERGD